MMEYVAVETQEDLLGTVVISRRGRDRGKPCIIIGWLPGDFVLIADGGLRNVAKPKKKNMKHLRFTLYCPGDLRSKLQSGGRVTDRMIKEGIAAYGGHTGKGV